MAHILMDADGSDGDWEDTLGEQRALRTAWLRDPRALMGRELPPAVVQPSAVYGPGEHVYGRDAAADRARVIADVLQAKREEEEARGRLQAGLFAVPMLLTGGLLLAGALPLWAVPLVLLSASLVVTGLRRVRGAGRCR